MRRPALSFFNRGYQGTGRWSRAQVEHGIWVSLGQDVPDEGIVEVTPRRFMAFDLERQGDIIGGHGRRKLVFTGPFVFDVVLCAPTPAGPFTDICRNTHRVSVVPMGIAEVCITWDGVRV